MLPVMQVGRVRPGAPPEHDVLHPVGGGLGQARPTNNIGMHGIPAHPQVVGARRSRRFRSRQPAAAISSRSRTRPGRRPSLLAAPSPVEPALPR
ncbi:MAG: hypothetical protein FJ404_17115 [Verrucomicrobia bacterium]|nr:hypothetical protein [Verrucomicrobiota bacterium]